MEEVKTSRQAVERMLDWAEGRLSHTNMLMQVEGALARPQTLAAIEAADAQEVVKWSAVAQALVAVETAVYPS